jgi:hypothetical protein
MRIRRLGRLRGHLRRPCPTMRIHPSMVAHEARSAPIVVHIDTQQLPSGRSAACRPATLSPAGQRWWLAHGGSGCHHVFPMIRQGHLIFADALARCATDAETPELEALAGRITAPLRATVHGRPGVGASTVGAALSAAGVVVVDAGADLDILVVAEVAKPEDLAEHPTLVVLTKADLTGFGPGGPIAAAHRRCAPLVTLIGAPTEPMVALLAVAALDDGVLDPSLLDALRVLVDEPADLRSPDTFVTCAHRLSAAVRQRLLDTLDLFGIAHSVLTLRQPGAGAPEVRAVLRAVSRIDEVIERIDTLAAAARYRRMALVVDELTALAISNRQIAAFLTADDTVLARMAAAVDVVQGVGLAVDPSDDPDAHLRRAVQWRRYGAAPLAALHRACAADIARGSLRLLAAAR